jgi:hypothetical protein
MKTISLTVIDLANEPKVAINPKATKKTKH